MTPANTNTPVLERMAAERACLNDAVRCGDEKTQAMHRARLEVLNAEAEAAGVAYGPMRLARRYGGSQCAPS